MTSRTAGDLRVKIPLDVKSPNRHYSEIRLMLPLPASAGEMFEYDTDPIPATPDSTDPGASWRENPIPPSSVKGSPKQYMIGLSGSVLNRPSYDAAGFSPDCQRIYFYNTSQVCVYELANAAAGPSLTSYSPILKRRSMNEGPIMRVALSANFLVVATTQQTRIIGVSSGESIQTLPNCNAPPSTLAVLERGIQLIIILGQCHGLPPSKCQGQIKICRYFIARGMESSHTTTNLGLLDGDYPKQLYIEADANLVCCVTGIQNKLLVWKVDDNLDKSDEPLEYVKNYYCPVKRCLLLYCQLIHR